MHLMDFLICQILKAGWTLEKFLVEKSRKRNKDYFDEDLCAYTTGETLQFFKNPQISQWFRDIKSFQVPYV